MSKEDRTVIERLEDIENKIPSSEKPRSFSGTTGVSVEEYLKLAEAYAYVEDERSLKKEKRDNATKVIVSIFLIFLFFVFSIVSFFINKDMEWMLIISASLSLFGLVIHLLAILKQKSKQLVRSFWSMERPEFYVTRKEGYFKVNKEERHSAFYYFALVSKIFAFVGIGVVFLYFALGISKYTDIEHNQILNKVFYYVGLAVGYATFFVDLFGLNQDAHKYYNYVFETDDFCFYYPSYELNKK